MYILIIIFQLLQFASAEANKPYESYDEIVDKLSSYRSQKLSTQLSTSLPRERFHISVGASNTSTNINMFGLGSVSHTGFLLGAAFPIIEKQFFLELNGKFYGGVDQDGISSDLQQFDSRLVHKESMEFAILNLGAGMSTRFLSVRGPDGTEVNYRIPSLLLMTGLERRFSTRMSLGADIGYHRSFKSDSNGKNTIELAFHLNYHL
jgi:hypothetical protein